MRERLLGLNKRQQNALWELAYAIIVALNYGVDPDGPLRVDDTAALSSYLRAYGQFWAAKHNVEATTLWNHSSYSAPQSPLLITAQCDLCQLIERNENSV